MNVSLYQAAAAMNAQARWQELITQNLAASAAPGYRKQDISFSSVQAGLDPTAANMNGVGYTIPAATASTNFSEGEMRATGNMLDVGIEGPGFLEVQQPNGTKAYTRDGELRLNSQGQLVTKQGYNVLGDGGPIQLDPSNPAPITISANGDISQGDQPKGHVRLVEFSQLNSLAPIGGGYFLASPDNPPPQRPPPRCARVPSKPRTVHPRPKWPTSSPPCVSSKRTRKCSKPRMIAWGRSSAIWAAHRRRKMSPQFKAQYPTPRTAGVARVAFRTWTFDLCSVPYTPQRQAWNHSR